MPIGRHKTTHQHANWTATIPDLSVPHRLTQLTTEQPRTRQLNSLHFNAYFLCMPRGWLLFDNPIQLVIKPKAVRYYMSISTNYSLFLLLTLLIKKRKLTNMVYFLTLPQTLNDQTSQSHCLETHTSTLRGILSFKVRYVGQR